MKTMFTVAGLSLLKTKKEKTFIIIMMGLALLFTSITGFVFRRPATDSKIPVGIADLDRSSLSAAMVLFLEAEGSYRISDLPEQELYEAVREGKIEVGFEIPAGFEKSLSSAEPLKVHVVSLSTSNTSMVIGKVMERKVTEHLLAQAVKSAALEQASSLTRPVSIDGEALSKSVALEYSERPALVVSFSNVTEAKEPVTSSYQSFSIGIYLMFTMFTVIFTAGDILQERRDLTWLRLMATPASRASIMAGKVMGAYATGAIQLAILLVAGKFLQKVDYGPNPLGIVVVLAVFLLAVTGLGIMLSTMVRTLAQLQTLAPIVIVSTCMLGGCYWPLEVVSPFMQMIAKFTPQAWAMTAATDLAARGLTLAETSTNLVMLLAFAAVFFGIGVARVKYE